MNIFQRVLEYFKSLVNISKYIDYETASGSIRKNIAFKGPNVIILACAIVIASVGLNVNSIPVIIGAMLISPVMGPILGFGLGLGTENRHLVKDSLKNFGVMVVISIVASSLFFLLSPLTLENPSELLARTNPTIYDVLIALFGGFAGILETSRKEKGTVISGVAIATALMPPLCTVGYGFSRLDWTYISGALYLFIINSIFISMATFLAVKLFKFPTVKEVDSNHQRLQKKWLWIILLIVIIPSVISAVQMVKENNFRINARQIVEENKTIGKSFIYDYRIINAAKADTLVLSLGGEPLSEDAREMLFRSAEKFGITRTQVKIVENATIKRENITDSELVTSFINQSNQQAIESKRLNDSITTLNDVLNSYKEKELPATDISKELFAMYPDIVSLSLTKGSIIESKKQSEDRQIMAFVTSNMPLPKEDQERIESLLKTRIENLLKTNLESKNMKFVFQSIIPDTPATETESKETKTDAE